jgi:hypothetical protein
MSQIQLITLYILLNEYSEFQFKRVVKQNDSLKVAIGKLEWFKAVHFFSWLLLKKMQDKTLRAFRVVKIGDGMLVPVLIEDKEA